MTLGEKIRKYRLLKGMTQRELGKPSVSRKARLMCASTSTKATKWRQRSTSGELLQYD